MEDVGQLVAKILGVLVMIASAAGSAWITVRYLLSVRIRLKVTDSRNLWDLIKSSGVKIVLVEEIVRDKSIAAEWHGIVKLNNSPWMYVTFEERLLTAGWTSKEQLVNVWLLRWSRKKLLKLLDELSVAQDNAINVSILHSYSCDKIGTLYKNSVNTPYVDPEFLTEIAKEVTDVITDKRDSTGILLYGPPGNGKSMLFRWIAVTYGLEIKIASINQDYNNADIVRMFANASNEPTLILFEDFDNMFNGRKSQFGKEGKFTFDAILNVLDGSYCTHKKTIFGMTTNHIDKIDDAIKNRPSRMRIVREIGNPDFYTRAEILGNDLALKTEGKSLDQVLDLAQRKLIS